jgi:hypothetical protein
VAAIRPSSAAVNGLVVVVVGVGTVYKNAGGRVEVEVEVVGRKVTIVPARRSRHPLAVLLALS